MAEDNKQQGGAQAKLGELFVDIGSSGLGSLIKGLNTVSASFLLTKNAATQALKPIIQMSQKGAQTVTHYDKLSAVMGLSVKQLRTLDIQARLSNMSFDELVGQLQNLQQQMIAFKTGRGGKMDAWAMLGISPRDLSDRNPMQALDLIMHRAMQLEPQRAAYALRELGISQDLLYFYQQQNKEMDKRSDLNDKEFESLRKQQRAWNNLKVTTSLVTDKLMANLPVITEFINGIAYTLMKLAPFLLNTLIPAIQQMKSAAQSTWESVATKIFGKEKVEADKQYMEEQRRRRHDSWQGILSRLNYQAYKQKHPGYNKSYREWQKEMGLKRTVGKDKGTYTPKKNTSTSASTGSTGVPTGQLTENSGLNNTQVRQLAQNFDLIPESELKSQGIDLSPIMPAQPVKNVTNTNNVTVTVNQNIASTDPAGAGRESAAQMNNAVKNTIAERSYLPGL